MNFLGDFIAGGYDGSHMLDILEEQNHILVKLSTFIEELEE